MKMTFLTTLLRRSQKRRMYADLMQLDDHLLRDIGLTRADLRARAVNVATATIVGAHARS
jgi:uncharacterized protein YjiS (DUF1127 family)